MYYTNINITKYVEIIRKIIYNGMNKNKKYKEENLMSVITVKMIIPAIKTFKKVIKIVF